MAYYQNAGEGVLGTVRALIDSYHPDLQLCDVRVGVQFAYATRDANGDPKGPAIKVHGRMAYGKVRKVGLSDRVAGMPDAMIYVDGDIWDTLSPDEQRSLLDHELEHLEIAKDKDENPIAEDDGRPKLKLKPHDLEVGIFESTLQRYGQKGIEARQVQDLSTFVQASFTVSDTEIPLEEVA